MTADGLTRCAGRCCWVAAAVDDRGSAHYANRDEAGAFRELPAPCWTLACAGCEEHYEDDEVGDVHFACPAEAQAQAEAAGWRLVGGRWLCPDCFGVADPEVRAAWAWSPPLTAPVGHPALIPLTDVAAPRRGILGGRT